MNRAPAVRSVGDCWCWRWCLVCNEDMINLKSYYIRYLATKTSFYLLRSMAHDDEKEFPVKWFWQDYLWIAGSLAEWLAKHAATATDWHLYFACSMLELHIDGFTVIKQTERQRLWKGNGCTRKCDWSEYVQQLEIEQSKFCNRVGVRVCCYNSLIDLYIQPAHVLRM